MPGGNTTDTPSPFPGGAAPEYTVPPRAFEEGRARTGGAHVSETRSGPIRSDEVETHGTDAGAEPDAGTPGGRIVELRVHGVGGARPESLLNDPDPRLVDGDVIAGFYRRASEADDGEGRGGAGRNGTNGARAGTEGHDGGNVIVEAYSWGGLTSRGAVRALWLLLLPFTLANMAGWMCPADLARRPVLFRVFRTAARWAALAVTLNLVLLVTWIFVDYLGYQCGTDPVCGGVSRLWAPRWVADHPARRILLAAAVPLALVALQTLLARRSARRYEGFRPLTAGGEHEPTCSGAAAPGGLCHRDFWNGERTVQRLSVAHVAAALALIALLIVHLSHAATVSVHTAPAPGDAAGVSALALGAAALAGALALLVAEQHRERLGRSSPRSPGRRSAVRFPPRPEIGLLVPAVAALAWAGVFAWSRPPAPTVPGEPPGMADALRLGGAGVVALLVPLAAVLVVTAVTRRGPRSGHRFRWCAPLVVLVLALAGMNAVLLGLLVQVASALGAVVFDAAPAEPYGIAVFPAVRDLAAALVILPLAVGAVFAVVQAVLYVRARFGREREEVRAEYLAADGVPAPGSGLVSAVADGDVPRAARGWAGKVAGARRIARVPHDVDLLLTALAGAVVAAMIVRWTWPGPLTTAATAIAAVLPVIGVGLLYDGWRDPERRRTIGVLWDIGTFWPRSYHPLAPPAYAERAVPELQRRVRRLHDDGERVVLAAHSQGSVLVAAALLQPGRGPHDHAVGLVTFGSPLIKLYARGFPAYIDEEVLGRITDARVPYWENLYYPTDPAAGPVRTAGCRDERLLDPATSLFRHGDRPPPIRGHGGYWRDPALRSAVRRAAGLVASASSAPSDGSPPVPSP